MPLQDMGMKTTRCQRLSLQENDIKRKSHMDIIL